MASAPAYIASKGDLDPHGPPQYDHSVPIPESAGMIQLQKAPRFSWTHVVLAAIGYLCCPIFGIVGLVAAMTSYTDHKVKDFVRANSKRRVALGFGLAAILMGIAGIIFVVYLSIKRANNLRN